MQDKKTDRPWTELSLSADVLIAKWGPNEGLWGIFNEGMIASPEKVNVHEWWLIVGTKSKHDQPDKPDEPIRGETFSYSVGTKNQMTIPRYLLPVGKQVLAQVIGFFDSKNERNESIVEGIYSDVERLKIPKP